MLAFRNSVFSKLSCLVAVSTLFTLALAPVQAQQYAGTANRRVTTTGDISSGKLKPKINPLRGLNFSTLGLFGDAEVFGQFNPPRQFIFALPNFAGRGLDFSNMTFDEYLSLVANSYELSDSSDYLFRFQVFNEVTAANPNFIPTFQQVLDAHRQDFVAGGGFLPLQGAPVTPTNPDDLPAPFEPLDPPFTPFPTGATADTTGTNNSPGNTGTDTSAATLLADSGILTDTQLNDAINLIDQASASSASQTAPQQAASVAVVPEPATLSLLVAGATALVGRRRH